MIYQLSADGAISGAQLQREIRVATGLAVTVAYDPPRTVTVDSDDPRIAAVVAAHVPTESDTVGARRIVAALVGGAVGKRWTDLTAAERQALITAALYKFGALDAQGRVKEIGEWL